MAFPVVEGSASNHTDNGLASHTINLPSGIQSGELLVIFFANGTDNTGADTTTSEPGAITGWTKTLTQDYLGAATSSATRLTIYQRVADGSEGASVSVATGVVCHSSSIAVRISGAASLTAVSDSRTSNGSTYASPALTPSWGSDDTLWFIVDTIRPNNSNSPNNSADNSGFTWPTNYTTNRLYHRGVGNIAGGTCVAVGYRNAAVATETPDVWTITTSRRHVVATLAFQPATAAVVTDNNKLSLASWNMPWNSTVPVPGAGTISLEDKQFLLAQPTSPLWGAAQATLTYPASLLAASP